MCCYGIYDNIDNDDFYFYVLLWDHWFYVIDLYIIIDLGFSFFICCLGLWVYNPCDMEIIYIIELGFIFFLCLLFLGMSVRDSFIILEV